MIQTEKEAFWCVCTCGSTVAALPGLQHRDNGFLQPSAQLHTLATLVLASCSLCQQGVLPAWRMQHWVDYPAAA